MIDTASHASQVDAVFARAPVIPVLTIERIEDAIPLARALSDNGLPVLEVTLRSACAVDAIALIARELADACVGAGTVLNARDLDAVAQAGARFAISPGATDSLYRAAAECPVPLIPGIATASELMRGLEHGWQRFKFFPAESSGGI
ncbi:MAG TPA: bifunctional 4-hydroxy-2-oxoglutarate aldolase/2-dehydro-3-deoxy-phosphogluconate aldolase, partial [Thermomonas sp.]|nr:bifunctional 4-hydroxy-2-oxoglutarate aldolase/2-dehydro-3-deoxy-phosphogluconate aldolase [Thermomonas sp.]